jgi:DNA invertase Pin-like site-specific DNA recombinase
MTKKPTAFVAYLRVRTIRQGESGLGVEAQRDAVESFVRQHGGAIVASFVEVETGKRSDRPELAKALEAARKAKATLLIAKLDQLARNVVFIANLMDAGVEFLACDQPFASRLTLHILAVAEDEARRISERTKAALQAAKACGRKLGSPIAAKTIAKARAARSVYVLHGRKPSKPVKSANAFSVRRPLQIEFQPPADRSNWRMTGRINWPSPNEGYGVPICEWATDEGTRIWLSAQLKELAVEFVDGAEDRRTELAMRSWALLGGVAQQFNGSLVGITLCYLHLAADVVA